MTIVIVPSGCVKIRSDEFRLRIGTDGRILSELCHILTPEQLRAEMVGGQFDKGKPCIIHLTVDNEEVIDVKTLAGVLATLKTSSNPSRQTTVYVHLRNFPE
jgi:hypothetical protein